jgi:transcriptional regulator with XRE-family HTH domain
MASTTGDDGSSPFSLEVGRRLRAVRRAKRLSLDEVERTSGGRWSASAVGAYERGFRNLTLPRLRELAGFYGVPMALLLGEVGAANRPGQPGKVVLDLERLGTVDDAGGIVRYLDAIILERGDFNGRIMSIRRDDVRALCAVSQSTEPELFDRLRGWGALISGAPDGA